MNTLEDFEKHKDVLLDVLRNAMMKACEDIGFENVKKLDWFSAKNLPADYLDKKHGE